MNSKARLAKLRRNASCGKVLHDRDVAVGGQKRGEADLARPPSPRTMRLLAEMADVVQQLRPVIQYQRRLERKREYSREQTKAKRALPWAKQQKPAKSTPPRPWVEKPWCQACDRYHVEGKHGPGRAK